MSESEVREFGFVQHWDGRKGKGFGFLQPDASNWGESLFFHFLSAENADEDFIDYRPGLFLSYVRGTGKNGKPEARQLRAEDSDEALGETGTVREWHSERNFGFINADSDNRSLFVHETMILGNNGTRKLEPGDRVWFQRALSNKTNQIVAVNVQIIPKDNQENENQN